MFSAPPAIEAHKLSLAYSGNTVLHEVDVRLHKGKVLALLGPSGCGKTTLLRLIAGLIAPTKGRIELGGKVAADAATGQFMPPEARGLGMVFQDYALWPHMSVAANVAFPLEMRGVGKAERQRRVAKALDMVGLSSMGLRRPSDMSGGQQQRVAIARAIVAEPPLVLFDEPLSNLDRELRESMVGELASLVASLGLTAVYVTHDQAEAFALADEVAIMHQCRIEQIAPPEELISAPSTATVAGFLRLGCVAPVRRCADGWQLDGTSVLLAANGDHEPGDAAFATVLLAAKAMRIGAKEGAALKGQVLRSQFRGDGHAVTLRLHGTDLDIQVTSPQRLHPGETIGLTINHEELRWFPGVAA
ncbi:ABC transporter ATP-binding protein [Aureimonas fodinaquatilis]|uniref:ABC transporter ATP-binding protein n=1 Tax=Aureimonas fodinaquatilis TaxID=2565783 RepID=A0A5B0DS36_9HYPH|nr:ABC transporter ATP-binding protein [Aureimonas fodinaquatilis]KAA0969617.1 ABC transporter ATP-binding protein [Aureimonas fodinaquatilis]